jgi:hypothetical protein
LRGSVSLLTLMRLLLFSGFAQGHEEIIERCPLLSLYAYTQQLEPLT